MKHYYEISFYRLYSLFSIIKMTKLNQAVIYNRKFWCYFGYNFHKYFNPFWSANFHYNTTSLEVYLFDWHLCCALTPSMSPTVWCNRRTLKAIQQIANVCNACIPTFVGIHNVLLNRARDAKAHIHFDHCPDKIMFRVDQILSIQCEIGIRGGHIKRWKVKKKKKRLN